MNKFYSLTLKEVRPETRNAVSLAFDVPGDLADKFSYKQGQHLIVRTSWLYSIHGQNFVKTILALCQKLEVLRIVSDQYGSPTHAKDLAKAIWAMIAHMDRHPEGPWGTYHFCSRGVVSWHDFATEIVRLRPVPPGGRKIRVEAITTADYPTAAARPAYSALDCSKLETHFGYPTPEWREALKPVVLSLAGTSG